MLYQQHVIEEEKAGCEAKNRKRLQGSKRMTIHRGRSLGIIGYVQGIYIGGCISQADSSMTKNGIVISTCSNILDLHASI